VADGVRDYLAMLNERDGGINGVKVVFEECETGYDTARASSATSRPSRRAQSAYMPWSTGATLAAIPRAHIDKIPILSMGYWALGLGGRREFPVGFHPAADLLGRRLRVHQIRRPEEGGLDKLKGKTIGLVHLDAPFGKEPIPVLETLAKEHGFNLKLYPVPADRDAEPVLRLARHPPRPAGLDLPPGLGRHEPHRVREAVPDRLQHEPARRRVVGRRRGRRPSHGRPGQGLQGLDWHEVGTNFPVIQDIVKHVVDKGQSQAPKEKVGENLYNRGVYQGMLIAEGIRNAQKLSGKKAITGEDLRRGLETLNMTEARWTELGAPGFAAPIQLSCADHNGHNKVYMVEWDGTKWTRGSDWIEPMKDKVRPLLEADAKSYAEKNAGWPKRTEACDRSS
jgi:branched-chain amino acid transport system substrate-binding protein